MFFMFPELMGQAADKIEGEQGGNLNADQRGLLALLRGDIAGSGVPLLQGGAQNLLANKKGASKPAPAQGTDQSQVPQVAPNYYSKQDEAGKLALLQSMIKRSRGGTDGA